MPKLVEYQDGEVDVKSRNPLRGTLALAFSVHARPSTGCPFVTRRSPIEIAPSASFGFNSTARLA